MNWLLDSVTSILARLANPRYPKQYVIYSRPYSEL